MVSFTPQQGPPSYVFVKSPTISASPPSSDISDDSESTEPIETPMVIKEPTPIADSVPVLPPSTPYNSSTDGTLVPELIATVTNETTTIAALLPRFVTPSKVCNSVRRFISGMWTHFALVYNRLFSGVGDLLQMSIETIGIFLVLFCIFTVHFSIIAFEVSVQTTRTLVIMLHRGVSSAANFLFRMKYRLAFISILLLGIVFPFLTATSSSDLQVVDYHGLMSIQNSTITSLMSSSGISYLSADLKKTEMATSDLALLVLYSDLPGCEGLAHELKTLSSTASTTSDSLIEFDAKVAMVVEQLLDFNTRNLRSLRRIENKGFFQHATQLLVWSHNPKEDAALLDNFAMSMDYMSEFIKALILDAQKHIIPLTKMANSLKNIQDLVKRDNAELLQSQKEVLSSLWTRLGGDKRRIAGFDDNLVLLGNVDVYREKAHLRVEGALFMLKNMQSKMEQLRLRLRAPELLRERFTLDEHLQSLETGIQNLLEVRKDIQAREAEVFRRFQLEDGLL